MLITRRTPRASENPLARMKRSDPKATPVMRSPSTCSPPLALRLERRAGPEGPRGSRRAPPRPRAPLPVGPGLPAAWREIAGEHGVSQELLGRLRPELARVGDGGEDRLVARPVHFEDVEGHDRVVEGIHAERPPRRHRQPRPDEGGDELVRMPVDPSRDRLEGRPGPPPVVGQRRVDPLGRRVGGLPPVGGRLAAVGLPPVPHERPSRGEGEILAVLVDDDHAHGVLPRRLEGVLVGHVRAPDERHLPREPELVVGAEEAGDVGSHEDGVDGVHVRPQLPHEGGVVGCREGRVDLLDDLPPRLLKGVLEAARRLPAVGVVLGDDRHAPVAQVLVDPLAEVEVGLALVMLVRAKVGTSLRCVRSSADEMGVMKATCRGPVTWMIASDSRARAPPPIRSTWSLSMSFRVFAITILGSACVSSTYSRTGTPPSLPPCCARYSWYPRTISSACSAIGPVRARGTPTRRRGAAPRMRGRGHDTAASTPTTRIHCTYRLITRSPPPRSPSVAPAAPSPGTDS